MSIRSITLAGGVLWGLLLALIVGALTLAFLASVSWLFLFGDGPWPKASETLLVASAATFAALAFGITIYLSVLLGRRLESWPAQAQAQKMAFLFTGASCLAIMATVAALYFGDQSNQQARATANQKEEHFVLFASSLHRISRIEQSQLSNRTAQLHLYLDGQRRGSYRFHWSIVDRLYKKTLLEGENSESLNSSSEPISLELDIEELAQSYQQQILTGPPGNVLVDQSFEFQAWLEPLLTSQERDSLPERELHNLSIGRSAMRFPFEGKVAVRFKALADGSLVF